jgi:hypothetical protein
VRARAAAEPGADAGRVDDHDPPGVGPALGQLVARLLGRADGAGDAAGDVDRDDVVAALDQRLVDGEEVPDRGLRRRRELARRAQVRVEAVEVRQVGLAVVLRRIAPAHVQRDDVEVVALGDLARHVVRRVRHHGDLGHGREP